MSARQYSKHGQNRAERCNACGVHTRRTGLALHEKAKHILEEDRELYTDDGDFKEPIRWSTLNHNGIEFHVAYSTFRHKPTGKFLTLFAYFSNEMVDDFEKHGYDRDAWLTANFANGTVGHLKHLRDKPYLCGAPDEENNNV